MKLEDIKAKVTEAIQGGRGLKLIGYHSSSAGTIADMVVKFGSGDTYQVLLRASLKWLGDMDKDSTPMPNELKESVTAVEWRQAKIEQQTAWQTSLQKDEAPHKFTRVPDGWWTDPTDPDTVVLRNMLADTMPPKKVATHKTGVTAAKAWLREASPMRNFVGLVKLSAAKVRDIEVV